MRLVLLLAVASVLFTSCSNDGKSAKTFCDTACRNDSFIFKGDDQLKQRVYISVKGCAADTIGWTHVNKAITAKIGLGDFAKTPLRLNQSAISVAFKDTSAAWVAFNDCVTGRGYLVKIKMTRFGGADVISGGLNSFVSKFSIDPDLRAYTDKGNLYIDNVVTGKEAQMTFKKEWDMDLNDVLKTIDTLNVTKQRAYIVLIDKDGKKVPIEKKIEL